MKFHPKIKYLIVLCLLLFGQAVRANDAADANRFFLIGDGKLSLKNNHTGKSLTIQYRNEDGTLNHAAFTAIDGIFGYPTTLQGENISRRMLAMLDHFSDEVAKGKTILIASGYRSQNYNNQLRAKGRTAAKTSTHIDGMAVDFSIAGVDANALWEHIRQKNCCGIGHYHGNILHLDSGRPRFWKTETAKVKSGASDFNRYIYLSTEYDRYNEGENVRMFFTSISDFGFGIKKNFSYVDAKNSDRKKYAGEIKGGSGDCLPISTRKDARFIYTHLPNEMKSGQYKVELEFCNKPFAQMPDKALSNVIEITK